MEHFVSDHLANEAVVIAENFADGLADQIQLYHEHLLLSDKVQQFEHILLEEDRFATENRMPNDERRRTQMIVATCATALQVTHESAAIAAYYSASNSAFQYEQFTRHSRNQERLAQAAILHDMYDHVLYHPRLFPSAWLSTNVYELAKLIDQQRAFEHLPILADALMDAGCDDDLILNHCRENHPHVRGCWVLDRILGKW